MEKHVLLNHLQKVVERLERIQESTEKTGWNYLEIEKHDIETDIHTLMNWKRNGFDTQVIENFEELCYKYDCKWIN